jgi:endonuclease/exonuclease/phosphatase family metal-dependent hydrolase
MMSSKLYLCSYNVLAQAYIGHLKTAGIPQQWLNLEHRVAKIIEQLQQIPWSIICLQEVEGHLVQELTQQFLDHTLFYNQRPQGKLDGLSMLIHKNIPVISQGSFVLPSGLGKLGSRIVQFVEIQWDDTPVIVINMHLSWNNPSLPNPAGTAEMKAVLHWLSSIPEQSMILCGDWNAKQGSALVDLLLKTPNRNLKSALAPEEPTYWGTNGFHGIDHIVVDANHIQIQETYRQEVNAMNFCPNQFEGSDHILIGACLVASWTTK